MEQLHRLAQLSARHWDRSLSDWLIHPRELLDSKPMDQAERLASLDELQQEAAGCTRCRLAEGRTQVVFGVGDPNADLMFVGEAPGFHEDKQGYPFVGSRPASSSTSCSRTSGSRAEVYIANVDQVPPAR